MATYRKICWTDADVKCPFYIKDDRAQRSISCEGCGRGCITATKFKELKLRDRHMGIYCVAKFEECPIYKMIYETKYAEDKKEIE